MTNAARLRRSLLAACLATTALAPAHAREDPDGAPLAERLSDPAEQAKAAIALSALSGALLSIDVSPLAKALGAVDPDMHQVPHATTLGDMAGSGLRDLPHDIARRTPQAMGSLAGMLDSLEAMRPQLKAMGRQLREQMRRDLPDE